MKILYREQVNLHWIDYLRSEIVNKLQNTSNMDKGITKNYDYVAWDANTNQTALSFFDFSFFFKALAIFIYLFIFSLPTSSSSLHSPSPLPPQGDY